MVVDRINWNNFNEAYDLIKRAKWYKEERGHYPARICADAISMTCDNKKFCMACQFGSVAELAKRNQRLKGSPRNNKSHSNQT